jgi:hypothetical protein
MDQRTAMSHQEAAEMEATEEALAGILEQLRDLREKMRADDAEIARLKVETAELKAGTKAILASLRQAA